MCGEQERGMGMSFTNTNQLLFQEAYIKLVIFYIHVVVWTLLGVIISIVLISFTELILYCCIN